MTTTFNPADLRKLYIPPKDSSGEDNGQVTIIAGSELFHGAALLATTVASRIVDMVFFTSPFEPLKHVADKVKSDLFSFIWVPFDEVEKYIEKSDAVLMGPGFMRYKTENIEQRTKEREKQFHLFQSHADREGHRTRKLTRHLLEKFPDKKWVIDGGSLQVMEASWIPKNAIVTPNKHEFQKLFGVPFNNFNLNEIEKMVEIMARKYTCNVVLKGSITYVSDEAQTIRVEGGNAGLTKGGTGDVLAGLTVALLAKNDPFLAACSASYVIKYAADEIYKEKGTFYNADDVGERIPEVLHQLLT